MKKKKRNRRYSGLKLSENKLFFGLFFLTLSLILTVNATFAWTSFAKWKYNHMQADENILIPNIAILGQLEPVVLSEKPVSRNIQVKNTGQIPVFIRVGLAETLLSFEIDTNDRTGNGNLKKYPDIPVLPEVQTAYLETWRVGHYFARKPQEYNLAIDKKEYNYQKSTANRPLDLQNLTLKFGELDPVVPPATGYWLYLDGYFYYSDILPVGAETTVLLTNISLTENLPNRLKGSLYQLQVRGEAGEATRAVYGDWQISEIDGNRVYSRFQQLLQN